MSKAQQSKAQEADEWEDVPEGDEEYDDEEEEEDTSIANSDVVMRYKAAAKWANEALTHVIGKCKPGASIKALCKEADELIEQKVGQLFKGVEKGVAFPTCISTNSMVCHFNGAEEDIALAAGDVARIDLGVHVDGYPAYVAHTVQVTDDGTLGDTREAHAISSCYAVLDAALRQVRPGASTTDVTNVIEKAAAHFGLAPVDGVLCHQMKRYIVDGFKTIPLKNSAEHKVHEYEIEPYSVWNLDMVLTTGKGQRLKEKDTKAMIFKASIDSQYEPKLQAAFEARGEIANRFQYFPFGVNRLENPKARLGISELARHGALMPYPVLFERDGEVVAQFKVTLLVNEKKIERVTGIAPQKGAPAPKPYTDEALIAASKMPLSLVKKEKKEKKAA